MLAPTGKTFDGWALSENPYLGGDPSVVDWTTGDAYYPGSIYPAGSPYVVTSSVSFTAQWTYVVSGENPFVGEWTGQMSGNGSSISGSVSLTSGAWSIATRSGQASSSESGSYTYTGSSAAFLDNYGKQVGAAYLSNDTLMLQMTGGAYSGMSGTFTKSSTSGQYTVTFNAQGGSVSPSTTNVNAGATVTTLPTPTRTGNYSFGGWFTQTNGGGTQFTASTVVNADITLYAKWVTTTTMDEGVYIGIISFAGDATDLTNGTPVLLNSSGVNSLTGPNGMINTKYNISSQIGTALFYGVHRALANLTAMTAYPDKLDSVNVITFTDGLDNGSSGIAEFYPIEGQTFDKDDDYATYVDGQIDTRTINGKPITAYSVGVLGDDFKGNTTEFENNLKLIASAGNDKKLDDFSSLQTTFNGIADNLLTVNSSTNFNMRTPLLSNGTQVLMTFDVPGTDHSDAEGSSKYLKGTITRTGTTYAFGSITYSSGLGSTQGAGPITGTVNGSEVTFAFTGMNGYDPVTDGAFDPVTQKPLNAKQWTMTSSQTQWVVNPEYKIGGGTNTQVEKRSAIIYLVLDASTSLDTTQIGHIRSAVNNFINSIYDRVK
jgi:hypothetical protein